MTKKEASFLVKKDGEKKMDDVKLAKIRHYRKDLMDVNDSHRVEIEVNRAGTILWVNVDGIARLRVYAKRGTIEVEPLDVTLRKMK